jgi:DNA-binding response OmpR family regulator
MASKPKSVLIIEDEKSLAGALELKLQKQGYAVTVVYDGKTGLERLSHHSYDVALLDLMMPVMDGFEVLTAAQKLSHAPVFIVLSNLTQPSDVNRCLELGARKFFVKSETSLAVIVAEIESL